MYEDILFDADEIAKILYSILNPTRIKQKMTIVKQ